MERIPPHRLLRGAGAANVLAKVLIAQRVTSHLHGRRALALPEDVDNEVPRGRAGKRGVEVGVEAVRRLWSSFIA